MWVNEQQQQQQAEVLRGAARRLGWPTQPSFNAGTLLWGPIDAQASLQEGGCHKEPRCRLPLNYHRAVTLANLETLV